MSKNNKKEPLVLVEIRINADDKFEIRIQKVDKATIPVIVGLLEKVKFDLLARDFDEDGAIEEDSLPINFMNNKFEA
jgi:hypothetical protein